MVKSETTVYAIILNYNNYIDTIECVENLLVSDYLNIKIIIVDNNSPNKSLQEIKNWLAKNIKEYTFYKGNENLLFNKKITLVHSLKNNGFANGNNVALRALTSINSFVFLVNPDIIVKKDTVSLLVNFFINANNKKTIASCQIFDYKTRKYLYSGGVKIKPISGTVNLIKEHNGTQLDYVCGGALFFCSNALTDVGLLPEDYFLYWEDADWCLTAKAKGYNLVTTKAEVYDKGATSIGRGYVAEYYYTRNSLIFHKKGNRQTVTIIASNIFFRLPKKLLLLQFSRAKGLLDGTRDFLLKKYINEPRKKININ